MWGTRLVKILLSTLTYSEGSSLDRKVTLADIARESGVSQSTVSLVLRNKGGMSEDTRQRVLDTAQALGYVYSPSNQSPRRSSPNTVGLIVKVRPDDSPDTNSFYAPVLAGIEGVLRRHQVSLVYANVPVDDTNHPLELPWILNEQDFDGLILVGVQLDQTKLDPILETGAPLVLADAYAPDNAHDSVVSDNYAGAYQATNHLIEHGHRKIAILGSQTEGFPSILERRHGFEAAMVDHDLEPIYWDCPLRPDAVAPVFAVFKAQDPAVSGIFAANDDIAIAAIASARALGLRVPEDLSIVGFDNIAPAQHVSPALTTMRVDKIGMGRLAAQLMLNRIDFPDSGMVRTVICPSLVRRASVMSIPPNH
ncbi:MAG: LacI family transcriptional regulator [Chloroflexi bacterium]|nr:LacI family transcriptional regulator [Chloroflexota bacterium]